MHGRILALTGGTAIAALDAVPSMLPAQTRRVRVAGPKVHQGEAFDAYFDPATGTLSDVNAATAFVPGLPNELVTHVYARGDTLPDTRFVSQTGRELHFSDLRGKIVLLSFVYTRCPDVSICPAISGKFAYLEHHLDPHRFQLVEMTLDPLHDSPAVLAAYGKQFGADPKMWSLVNGEPAQVKNLIDGFALAPLETNPGRIIHGDTLVITDRTGRIADIIPTAGWNPDDVVATAEAIDGQASNPLRRFELATIAGVIAFCGGSLTTGQIVLDSAVFIIGVGILGGLLIWITKRVIIDERY